MIFSELCCELFPVLLAIVYHEKASGVDISHYPAICGRVF